MHLLIFLLLPLTLFAADSDWDYGLPELWYEECEPCIPKPPCFDPITLKTDKVEAHLKNPIFKDGVLSTDEGGTLKGPKIRIQARKVRYVTEPKHEPPLSNVYCEGDLLIEYGSWTITADAIFYDFMTETGYILNGYTASSPWYVGGREMTIDSSGELIVHDGYLTTSEGKNQKDPCLCAKRLTLYKNRIASARNVQFRALKTPLLWTPAMRVNLKKLSRSPFSFKFGWGRYSFEYFSILYNFMDWNDIKAWARVDAFLKYGLGAGIDAQYDPPKSDAAIYTRNYWVKDLAIDTPSARTRWRYQGTYANRHWDKALTIKAQYDFVSDGQMAYTYRTKDFDLKTAGATKFLIRNEENNYIANLEGWIQVNRFQSVNQKLPLFSLNLRPNEIGDSGIIFSGEATGGYLNYVFSTSVNPRTNFNGGRFSACPNLSRPFQSQYGSLTPYAGLIGIYYINSPGASQVGQAVGKFGVDFDTSFYKTVGCLKHVAEPYIHYVYYTDPVSPLSDHYIFSIDDGWNMMNQMLFGFSNSFYLKNRCPDCFLWFNVWANAFFGKNALPVTIPTGFFDMDFKPLPWTNFSMRSGYSFAYHSNYYMNAYLDFTFSENFAMGFGYRTRSKYYIRKEDFYNFMLDMTRTADELDQTALSDGRKIFLFRTFFRPRPGLTAKFDLRNGWHRVNQAPFSEYKLDLGATVFQHWDMNFVIEHFETEMRYSFSMKLPTSPP